MEKYKSKKVKNPAVSLWKEEERKRKKKGKVTKMILTPKKIVLSFN